MKPDLPGVILLAGTVLYVLAFAGWLAEAMIAEPPHGAWQWSVALGLWGCVLGMSFMCCVLWKVFRE